MKGKLFLIFLSFGIAFCIGISVSYYNTRSYGFEENVTVFASDEEKIKVLDFEIYYKDIDNYIYNTLYKTKDFLPKAPITVSCYTV